MTMRRRYVTTDVFTDRRFGGNPLAVVLDAEGLSSAELQAIATEFNYSETTFVLPPRDPANTAWVRIFTPRSEVPFAGHPNVGTAFVLAEEILSRGEPLPESFMFEEGAGLVPVRLLRDDDAVVGAELTAPVPLSHGAELTPEQVAACLSLPLEDIRTDAHPPKVVSVGLPFVMVELATRDALSRAKANSAAHEELLPPIGAEGVYAYTRDADAGCDIQARMFAPLDAVVEDPATGSATAAAVALLAELAGGDVSLRFGQGFDMGRPSLLDARVTRGAVHVGGRCVPVMTGSFEL
jgi:trans-2,3-dihydro-3-hydroxyanthranilate isomerase